MLRTFLFIMSGMSLASWLLAADANQQLSKIDRHIGKQPKYIADQPLFGLVVFGSKLKTRVWIVLDKSAPSKTRYDVAYVDLNANTDLTDQGERFTAAGEDDSELRFKLPDFTDPSTGETHTEFSLRSAPKEAYQMVTVKWRDKQKFGGGYTHNPDEESYSRFTSSPNNAPVLWLNGDGPFTFQRWYTDPLQIGRETDVSLFIGVPGVGPSTFCAFQVHALPAGEGIQGILHYSTSSGEQRQSAFALSNKC